MKRILTLYILISTSIIISAQQSTLYLSPKSENQRLGFSLSEGESSVFLCHLLPNETYRLTVTSNSGLPVKIYLNQQAEGSTNTLIFNAQSACQELFFIFPVRSGNLDFVLTVSHITTGKPSNGDEKVGSITTAQNGDVGSLIRDVFIGGNCFDVAAVSFSGASKQLGTFGNGSSSINIETGVIISTGDIANSVGPNIAEDITTGFGAGGSDSDLDAISNGGALYDIAKIEFDFTPTEDMVTFEYAFASDEYCEWVGSEFNDVFGFFISGPGINGPYSNNAENIAIVPGLLNQNVAINSVNNLSNTAFYRDNSIFEPCGSGSPVAPDDIEFDGFTTVLTAVANVTACETYHIKLIIADRGDDIYDSAVFLKANSFGGQLEASVETEIVGHSDGALSGYEGCSNAVLTFTRLGDDLSEDVIVNYTIGAESTATPGDDYSPLPVNIIIPAGETSVTISIEIFQDFIAEGTENVIIELERACSCTNSTIEILLLEPPPIEVVFDDLEVCRGEASTIVPTVTGGIPPYTYQWSDGTASETFDVNIEQSSSFSVTVSDDCTGAEATVFTVNSIFPTAEISGSGALCQGGDAPYLNIDLTGNGPWDVTYSVNGTLTTVEGIDYSPYPIFADYPGTYTLVSVTGAEGCPGDVSGSSIVDEVVVGIVPTITQVSCYGVNDGAIQLEVSGGTAPYSYEWIYDDLPNSNTVNNLTPDAYDVTVTDAFGCTATIVAYIEEPEELLAEVTDLTSIDCINTSGSISVAASGGNEPYNFEWEDGAVTPTLTGLSAGTYALTITDDSNCQTTLEATIEEATNYPEVMLGIEGELNCITSVVAVSAAVPNVDDPTYQWFSPDGVLLSDSDSEIDVLSEGIYTVVVTDPSNFCTTTATTEVAADHVPPVVVAAADDNLDCLIQQTTLNGEGSASGANIQYQWSTSDGHIVSGVESLNPLIDAPGTYTLSVLNTTNGCSETDEVTVEQDISLPHVVLQSPEQINCETTSVDITSEGSDNGAQFVYEWTSVDGMITGATDSTFVNVSAAGTYVLSILNTNNGCQNSMDIPVASDTVLPDVDAGDDIELDCLGTAVQLNGSASMGPSFTYQWSTDDGAILSGAQSLSPETAVAGTYQLQVINTDNGCVATDENTVFNNAGALEVTANVNDILDCNRASVAIHSSITDNQANFSATWSSLESNPIDQPDSLNINVNLPGTYALQVLNLDNGCISQASVTVEQNISTPLADAGADQLINCNEMTAVLDASNSDIGGDFLISWTYPDGSIPEDANESQLQVDQSGTFLLTVLNTENGCESSDEVVVDADFALPIVAAGSNQTLNCAVTEVVLNGTANANGHDFEFEWRDLISDSIITTNNINATVDLPGIYALSVLDTMNGCRSQDSVQVFLDVVSPVADAVVADVLNCNNETVILSTGVSSQGENILYEWSSLAQNTVISTDNNPEVNAPGSYQLIVKNTENFCRDTALVQVEQDIKAPIAGILPPDVLSCSELTVALDASTSSTGAGFSYIWTLPNGTQLPPTDTPMTFAQTEGLYGLTVRNNQNGCTAQASVSVESVADFPIVEAGPEQLINCYQPQVELNPAGSESDENFLYEWQLNGVLISQSTNPEVISVETPGQYQLFITNTINNCRSADSVLVNIDITPPIASAGMAATLNCAQSSLNLNASQSSPGLDYNWTTVIGTIANGADTPTPLISSPGIYRLEVTNPENGCQAFDEVEIYQDTLHPQIQIPTPEVLTCELTSLSLDANSDGNYEYVWMNENQEILGYSTSILVEQPGIYQFVATNSTNFCESMRNIEVLQDITPPNAIAEGDNMLDCITTSIQLDGSLSSANSAYEWTTADGVIQSGSNGLTPVITAPGTYTIHVVDSFNGCDAFDSILVEQDIEEPVAFAASNGILTCTQTSVELMGESNLDDPANYQWLTTSGEIINTGISTLITQPGNYQFYVYNPVNGCDNHYDVSVGQDIETPIVEAGEAAALTCNVAQLTLNGSVNAPLGSSYLFDWSGPAGGILSNANTVHPLIHLAGDYTLQVTNTENGCVGSDVVSVDLVEPTGFEYEIQQPLCHGDQAFLNIQAIEGGAEPFVYSIDAGNEFSQNSSFGLSYPGVYFVAVQDANGCEYLQGVEVIDVPEVAITLAPLATIELGEQYQIQAVVNIPDEDIASIIWTPADDLDCTDCLDPIASPLRTTDYMLEVVNTNGCRDQAPLKLIVDNRPKIFIPNAFSPNGDGINDVFYIFAKDNSVRNINVLQIYSRWGESVFEVYNFQPNDPTFGWDGTYRNEKMNPAVFTYWTEIELINGETIIMKGDVTIAF